MVSYKDANPKQNKKAQVPKLSPKECLGCGVCVVKCPTKSLMLVEKANIVDPPQNVYDWSSRYMEDVKKGVVKKRSKN